MTYLLLFRAVRPDTPVYVKKSEKTFQELIDGFERTHPRVSNSKLPRAVHKPSTLAIIDRRHSYTGGEISHPTHKMGVESDLTGQEIEKLVKEEMLGVQEKLKSLKENLSRCSHDIEMIQREQSDIFQRYEAYIGRNTPDLKGKKHCAIQKDGLTLPPINQRATLTNNGGNGGHDMTDKATKISNIKKIARKRSNELAMREADPNAVKGSWDINLAKQTTSDEDLQKFSKLNKSKEAVRRAIVQSLRMREKSAKQSRLNQQMFDPENKRTDEVKMRQADNDADKGSWDENQARQATSNEEVRKSSKHNKSKEAIRRAIFQSLRKREKSATQSQLNQRKLDSANVHESDSKATQILDGRDTPRKLHKPNRKP